METTRLSRILVGGISRISTRNQRKRREVLWYCGVKARQRFKDLAKPIQKDGYEIHPHLDANKEASVFGKIAITCLASISPEKETDNVSFAQGLLKNVSPLRLPYVSVTLTGFYEKGLTERVSFFGRVLCDFTGRRSSWFLGL